MNTERVSRVYVSGALLLVNTLVVFIVLNAGAYLLLSIYEYFTEADPVSEKYGEDRLETVYPGMSGGEIKELLHETWSRPYVYEPFTQFRERVSRGEYVNVDANGFRRSKEQAAWPPPADDINIFLFGGSTTFGYGVEDSQTIGSHLQERMRSLLGRKVNVYNFGRGFYFSTQERILFESLMAAGHVPDLAIFIDGLNDFYHYDGKPLYTERLARYVSGEARKITRLSKLPVVKLFDAMLGTTGDSAEVLDDAAGKIRYDDREILDGVIARYLENRKIIEAVAAAYGVRPVFVWQPVPTYKYDTGYHLFARKDFARHTFSQYGYPLMKAYMDSHDQDDDFLWAADLQEGVKEPLYVDQVHYTGKFSSRLAEFISGYLISNFYQVNVSVYRVTDHSMPQTGEQFR